MPFGLQDIGATVDMSGWDEAAGYASSSREDTGPKTIKSFVHRLQKNVSSARDHAYAICRLLLMVVLACWVVYQDWGIYFMGFPMLRHCCLIHCSLKFKEWGSWHGRS